MYLRLFVFGPVAAGIQYRIVEVSANFSFIELYKHGPFTVPQLYEYLLNQICSDYLWNKIGGVSDEPTEETEIYPFEHFHLLICSLTGILIRLILYINDRS
jgi:hypothetical protein